MVRKRQLKPCGAAGGKNRPCSEAVATICKPKRRKTVASGSSGSPEALPPFKRVFWCGAQPPPGEPDAALKLVRKEWGIKLQGAPAPPPVTCFSDTNLPSEFTVVIRALQGPTVKLASPTPIQMQAWPAALCGLDVLGIAPTGSGKTLAYMLPAVTHALGQAPRQASGSATPNCLVILPTRELASQVFESCGGGRLQKLLGLRVAAVYGGMDRTAQLEKLVGSNLGNKTVASLLCATPGRLLELLGLAALSLEHTTYFVLDEADKMLQHGFEQQLEAITNAMRPDRQTLLFSATFPGQLQQAANRWMSSERVLIRVSTMEFGAATEQKASGRQLLQSTNENSTEAEQQVRSDGGQVSLAENEARSEGAEPGAKRRDFDTSSLTVAENIEQQVQVCAMHKRSKKLIGFVEKMRNEERAAGSRQPSAMLIFCNRIAAVKEVVDFLWRQSIKCVALHSQLPQAVREKSLQDFKVGRCATLVATDVAARGLHVRRLRFVVNYDFPSNLEQYCHRIGRAGRDGSRGIALSFLTRNFSPLAGSLVDLLRRTGAAVDPNLVMLAAGETSQSGGAAAAAAEPAKPIKKRPTAVTKNGAKMVADARGNDERQAARGKPRAAKREDDSTGGAVSDISEDLDGSVGFGGGIIIRPKAAHDIATASSSDGEATTTGNNAKSRVALRRSRKRR